MSELVPIYKGKGDVLEYSSSRGIKLLENGMKVAERVLEKRLRHVEWAMRKLGVEEWLVRAVIAMYKYARTRVRSYDGSVSEWFGVNVGVYQGSVLSPLFFIMVMEAVTHTVRGSTMGDAVH